MRASKMLTGKSQSNDAETRKARRQASVMIQSPRSIVPKDLERGPEKKVVQAMEMEVPAGKDLKLLKMPKIWRTGRS